MGLGYVDGCNKLGRRSPALNRLVLDKDWPRFWYGVAGCGLGELVLIFTGKAGTGGICDDEEACRGGTIG
jgi:hypothetical protein